LVWFGLVWFGLVWFGLVWFGLVWFGLVWFGLVWFGLVWFGLVWFGLGALTSFLDSNSLQLSRASGFFITVLWSILQTVLPVAREKKCSIYAVRNARLHW
jgi:hypothetical protein